MRPRSPVPATGPLAVTPAPGARDGGGLAAHPPRTAQVARALLEGEGWGALVLAVDAAALTLAFALATDQADAARLAPASLACVLAFPLATVGALAVLRRSPTRQQQAPGPELGSACLTTLVVAALLTALPAWLGEGTGATGPLAALALAGAGLLALGRVGVVAARAAALRRGLGQSPALIFGAGRVGEELARQLRERPTYGLRPIGFLDGDPPPGPRSLPVLGGQVDLEAIARDSGARHVLVAYGAMADSELRERVAEAQGLGLQVSVVPRLFDRLSERTGMDCVGGLPLMHLHQASRSRAMLVKHAFDRVAAGALLVALGPVLTLLALAVRLTSPGPALFVQVRVGRDGRPFPMLKFRTMRGEGEHVAPAAGDAPGGVEGEDRRTRLGIWLRRTSVDELPQLVNVLRGEMSLVGPRPERPEFAALFASDMDRYDERHRVRSGMTGLAQVNGLRGQTRLDDRVRWDNWYIESWSLALDLRILVRTVGAVFFAAE